MLAGERLHRKTHHITVRVGGKTTLKRPPIPCPGAWSLCSDWEGVPIRRKGDGRFLTNYPCDIHVLPAVQLLFRQVRVLEDLDERHDENS